jgi:CheY-like chemotaxis protein
MGGDVSLLYSELGRGSCFRIVLPMEHVEGSTMMQSPIPIKSKEEPKPVSAALKLNGRILLAEDGLDNQRLIAFMLRKAGATIEIADNGRIALNILNQAEAAGKPFDMLLTDMQMPEMDGYSLASTLRDLNSKIQKIAKSVLMQDATTTSPSQSIKKISLRSAPIGSANAAGRINSPESRQHIPIANCQQRGVSVLGRHYSFFLR